MSSLKTGDIVVLKSGGPKMTIKGQAWNPTKGIYETDKYTCNWFENNTPREAKFHVEMLDIIAK